MGMLVRRGDLRWALALFVFLTVGMLAAQTAGDPLEQGFRNPPDGAKPRVWWHWMSGNVTKEGIQLDLEWMKRVGIGGFQNFDAALNTPKVVEKRLVYMTPEWRDAFRFAASLADKLGLEMAIAGSPGWSESGGPWVPPSQGMKKYVWSELAIEGGRPFTGVLPKPPTATGPFQNAPYGRGFGSSSTEPPPVYYADSAVVACRAPASDVVASGLQPKIASSGGQFDLASLTDGDLARATALPMAPVNEKSWIQYEFDRPQTIQALTLVLHGGGRSMFGRGGESGQQLEASDDGQQFRPVVVVPTGGAASRTLAFPEVTAKFFRVTFRTMPLPAAGAIPGMGGARPPETPRAYQIAELVLHPGARLNRFEEKAGFATLPDIYAVSTSPVAAADAIAKPDVIDLTSRMRPDGTLEWTAPPGKWLVLRFGYSLLGIMNHPASPEATGLEVDKLSRPAVKAYVDNYLNQYKDTVGELMGKRGLRYVITDSWEAGTQNWTDDMFAEFAKRRRYDMHPWLPVLTGRVVESAESSERFLWDFRTTIGELTAEYHYEQISESLHERGMGRYTESHESGRAFIGDGMDVKRKAEVPMSAMWTPRPGTNPDQYDADVRESASVAHIYGQNIVAAESLTAGTGAWAFAPETLKPTADRLLAMGLNRFVIHTSVHQPLSDKVPGFSLGPFGQWFTRHDTWAELAQPWVTYLARSSYMLQQGQFVADVIYFYGEDSNVTALFRSNAPEIPAGYNFDYASADVVLTRLSAKAGRIATPSGMSYRLLALDPRCRRMSLPVLRKLRDLVRAGACITGVKPVESPSLSDSQAEFRAIADELWTDGKGVRFVGNGRVFGGQTIAAALDELNAGPDFEYTRPQPGTTLLFVHRRLSDGDVYWVNNRSARVEELDATFRVQGKAAELWHADTGKIEPASYRIAGDRTTVPLRLGPNDSVFVVFRKAAAAPSRAVPSPVETTLAVVEGGWEVSFQPDRGAPAKITLERLASWSENPDAGVRFFSGTGTYTSKIDAPGAWFRPGNRLIIDLGDVKNFAEVTVNGKLLGLCWLPPFRIDATAALKPGVNMVEVKVTNLWVNRLIGDEQPGIPKKYTFTTQKFYRADSPLLPSGLLGPVQVVASRLP
jgi:hypothetical protein